MVVPRNRSGTQKHSCSRAEERTGSLGMTQPGNIIRLLTLLLIWYAMLQGGVPVGELPVPTPTDQSESDSPFSRPPPVDTAVLAGKVVAIDPGHGGAETGAVGVAGSREKDNTLAAALAIKRVLEEVGATVVLTREGDYEPHLDLLSPGASLTDRLQQRVRVAAQAKADVFISIHNDWNYNPALTGTTTYYWNSPRLAHCVQEALVRSLGSRSVGTLRRGFYVVMEAPMPAVLVELGFLSNAADEELLQSDWYHTLAGEGIRDGLVSYFGGQ